MENRNYHHPYEPYDIQQAFMNAVYQCLEQGKIGIFESPTGTGKSLSLICGSLTWLRDHKRSLYELGDISYQPTSDEPQWMLEHAQNQAKEQAFRSRQELNERIARIQAKERQVKERYENDEPPFKKQRRMAANPDEDEAENAFMLGDYDNESNTGDARRGGLDDMGLSHETRALLQNLGFSQDNRGSIEDSDNNETKIIVASRTHSQLSQFANELRRVKMPSYTPLNEPSQQYGDEKLVENVKYLTLGSRKNLCINGKVKRLGNATAINERCIELQKSTSSADRCQYMPTKEHEALLHDFRDHALARVRDIEDLGLLGRKLDICPYYASRAVADFSEVGRICPRFTACRD